MGNEGGLGGDPAASAVGAAVAGASALQALGDHCGLPFAGLATALIGGAAEAVAEHVKAKRAAFVTGIFYTPQRAETVAEAVASATCLRLRTQLQRLEEEEEEELMEAAAEEEEEEE